MMLSSVVRVTWLVLNPHIDRLENGTTGRVSYKVQEQGEEPTVVKYVRGFYLKWSFKYVEGYQVFCTDCNKLCHCSMSFYPCKEAWILDRVKCRLGCGKTWRLRVDCEKPICH